MPVSLCSSCFINLHLPKHIARNESGISADSFRSSGVVWLSFFEKVSLNLVLSRSTSDMVTADNVHTTDFDERVMVALRSECATHYQIFSLYPSVRSDFFHANLLKCIASPVAQARCPPENFRWFYWLKLFSLCLHWLVFQVDSGPHRMSQQAPNNL